jgi:NAD(P)-dependent dehydrogenase (short-subunit alcohol dehydrogenase family)
MTRVAVVTGGASGIGEATARLLGQRGVAVAVFEVTVDDAVDVTDPEVVRRGVDRARREPGPVDIVVNCAGVPAPAGLPAEPTARSVREPITVSANLVLALSVTRYLRAFHKFRGTKRGKSTRLLPGNCEKASARHVRNRTRWG